MKKECIKKLKKDSSEISMKEILETIQKYNNYVDVFKSENPQSKVVIKKIYDAPSEIIKNDKAIKSFRNFILSSRELKIDIDKYLNYILNKIYKETKEKKIYFYNQVLSSKVLLSIKNRGGFKISKGIKKIETEKLVPLQEFVNFGEKSKKIILTQDWFSDYGVRMVRKFLNDRTDMNSIIKIWIENNIKKFLRGERIKKFENKLKEMIEKNKSL